MNSNRKVYTYSYLFVTGLLFSVLASEIFLLYLHMRDGYWILEEPYIVGIIGIISFSAIGQKVSKINSIGRYILFVSAICSILSFQFFFALQIANDPVELTLMVSSWHISCSSKKTKSPIEN